MWMPSGESTIASEVDALFYFILYAAIFFFVLVTVLTTYFVIRYRRRGKATTTWGGDHNLKLEILWTAIPTVLVVIVFIWGFKTYIRMNIVPKDAIEVKVTGQKWFWTFDYAEGASSVNELVVPEGKPIKLLMSSKDVIHSFFVPNFRMKMDVLPNRYSISWFEAPRAGEYDLFCTEFCGTGHSEMIGKVKVVSDAQYAEWLEAGAGTGEGLALEDFGRQLYVSKACITCHKIDGSAGTGPSFVGVYGSKEKLKDGSEVQVDENYIRESILNPQAKVTFGYPPVMPTYQGILKDKQIDALIAFIKTLEKQEGQK